MERRTLVEHVREVHGTQRPAGLGRPTPQRFDSRRHIVTACSSGNDETIALPASTTSSAFHRGESKTNCEVKPSATPETMNKPASVQRCQGVRKSRKQRA